MKDAVGSEIHIDESFLNILQEDSGSVPHTHLTPFDENNNLIKNKFSLVQFLLGKPECRNTTGSYKNASHMTYLKNAFNISI